MPYTPPYSYIEGPTQGISPYGQTSGPTAFAPDGGDGSLLYGFGYDGYGYIAGQLGSCIFKSTDAGLTWNLIYAASAGGYNPGNNDNPAVGFFKYGNKVYAVQWDRFPSSGPDSAGVRVWTFDLATEVVSAPVVLTGITSWRLAGQPTFWFPVQDPDNPQYVFLVYNGQRVTFSGGLSWRPYVGKIDLATLVVVGTTGLYGSADATAKTTYTSYLGVVSAGTFHTFVLRFNYDLAVDSTITYNSWDGSTLVTKPVLDVPPPGLLYADFSFPGAAPAQVWDGKVGAAFAVNLVGSGTSNAKIQWIWSALSDLSIWTQEQIVDGPWANTLLAGDPSDSNFYLTNLGGHFLLSYSTIIWDVPPSTGPWYRAWLYEADIPVGQPVLYYALPEPGTVQGNGHYDVLYQQRSSGGTWGAAVRIAVLPGCDAISCDLGDDLAYPVTTALALSLPSPVPPVPLPHTQIVDLGPRCQRPQLNRYDDCLARDLRDLRRFLYTSLDRRFKEFVCAINCHEWPGERFPTELDPASLEKMAQTERLQRIGNIPPPAVGIDTTVLTFTVPTGYHLLIDGYFHYWTGGPVNEGAGDLIWRISVGGAYPHGMGAMLVSQGSLELPWYVDGGLVARSGSRVRYIVQNTASGVVPPGDGSCIAGIVGIRVPWRALRGEEYRVKRFLQP